jgi:methionyl-tRNA formyltransferase
MGDTEEMKRFNILMITQDDPFYVREFFEEFLKRYPCPQELRGVVIAPAMGKKTFAQLIKQMYDFYGLKDFLRMGFRYAFYKTGDIVSRRIPLGRSYSIAQVCSRHKVPVFHRANINSEVFLNEIRKLDLDLIISVAAPQIFKEKLIGTPRKGCINIHNSKLPKYRGMLPNFWQMFHGEKTVGTTIHYINAGLDDGEILMQKETSIGENESLDSLIRKTKKFGAEMMVEAIAGIKTGSLKPRPNLKEESTYFTFPTKKNVREFRRKGYRLV